MKELENLLNSLMKRGWKPFNYIWTVDRIEIDDNFEISIIFITWEFSYHTIRDLVVLESWLWQFVCERWFCRYDENADYRRDKLTIHPLCLDCEEKTLEKNWDSDPEYRLLESALIPEEGLGKFLLDNIKLKW